MLIFLHALILMGVVSLRWRDFMGSRLKPAPSASFPNALDRVSRGKPGRVVYRSIGLEQTAPFPFIVQQERWYHVLLKKVGVAHEISVGNPTIDGKFFFITDYPNHLERSLKSPGLQGAIETLFTLSVKSLFVSSQKTWCVMETGGVMREEEHYDRIRTILKRIAGALQEGEEESSLRFRMNTGYWAFLSIAFHIGFFITGLFAAFPAIPYPIDVVNNGELWAMGLLSGLLAASAWAALLLWFFRGTSWAGWVFADFLLVGLAGIVMLVGFELRELNIELDTAPATVHTQKVVERSCSLTCSRGSGKRRRSRTFTLTPAQCEAASRPQTLAEHLGRDPKCQYDTTFNFYLAVTPWYEGRREPYEFYPKSDLFDAVPLGGKINITSHPGYFGMEWVDIKGFQPAP